MLSKFHLLTTLAQISASRYILPCQPSQPIIRHQITQTIHSCCIGHLHTTNSKLQSQHLPSQTISISIHPFFPLLIFHLHPKKNYIHSSNSLQMASITSSLVSIPSFTGLKSARATSSRVTATAKVSAAPAPRLSLKASLKEVGVAVVATAASALLLASNAMALDVLFGSDDGGLAFVPSEFSVSSGEKITFKNNKGFPHNVVFDEDEVPSGVDVSKISMSEEDLLNAEGETFSVTLTTKGTYKFYCAPHQGAGMVGQVTVK